MDPQTYIGESAHTQSALVFVCPVCDFTRPAEDWCRDCWCCEVCCDCDDDDRTGGAV